MYPVTPNERQFFGATDSETIQNAVNYADANDLGRVVIPRYNARTGKCVWNIDAAILLPSNMTVVLEDAHLRLADGCFDNIFRNRNCMTPEGNTLEGEQHNIHIIGSGNALLDGGVHNGLVEQMHRDDPEKYPRLSVNLLIFLHNTRDFSIEGLDFINGRWWAVCCVYCRWGYIGNLDFKMYGTCENQDGVDLRVGCEYITIENITGLTGDDTIALTAMPNDDLVPETALHVPGKRWDIHDIAIRNVISSSHGCGIVRFLCEDGAQEYNITVDGIKDTSQTISGTSIIVGTADTHFADPPHKMGEFRDIVVRNITTQAQRGISFSESVKNMLVENLTTYGANEVGLRFTKNFECDNLVIRNVNIGSDPETLDSVFWMNRNPERMLKDLRVENVRANSAKYVFRETEFAVENLQYEAPSVAYYTPETTKLASAYGRYHRCAYGKVIENRPPDARYDSQGNKKQYVSAGHS
ncbi:MAG: hypothetical protein J6L24_04655 [Oscillospiraceae bacterium]|nr:hypothetical protein [Oscillospiraceae bacterium]